MEIIVLVLGTVGFVMSWVIVGAVPAAVALLLGAIRLMIKKKPLRKLGKFETVLGMVFAALGVLIGVYVYYAGIMDIDFVRIVRDDINDLISAVTAFFKRF